MAVVMKFDDRLSSEFVLVIYLVFSDNTAARSHSNHMEEKVASLVAEDKKWRDIEKMASEKATKADELSTKAEEAKKKAEEQATRAEEARKKDEGELSSA
nr:hypothetical protein TIFTF001_056326 [Ficus carica]GMN75614.1 hypothetical protein TIFTF001_056329 [Ficus carica]